MVGAPAAAGLSSWRAACRGLLSGCIWRSSTQRRFCRPRRSRIWSTVAAAFGRIWRSPAPRCFFCPMCAGKCGRRSAPSSRPSARPVSSSITSPRTSIFTCILQFCRRSSSWLRNSGRRRFARQSEPQGVLARIEGAQPSLTASAFAPLARLQRARLKRAGVACA